jgi:hypothetical protein
VSPVTPQKPPDTRPPTQPKTPPPQPPKRGLVAQVAAVRTQAIGASVVLRLVEVPVSAAARDRARLAQYLEIAAASLRDARAALDAALAQAQWIADCALLDEVDAIRADLQSPARQVFLPRCAAEGPSRSATPDGPVSSGRDEFVDPSSRPVFTLPLRPAVPRFDAELLGQGPQYDALPATQVGVAEYGGAR